MQDKRSFLLLTLLIITGVLITGCASNNIPEEDVGLEIAYDDEMGKVLLNDEEVEPGEEVMFEKGSAVNLEAEASGGSRFLEWSNSGENQKEIDLILDEDKALIARFLVPLEVEIDCLDEDVGFDLEEYIEPDKLIVEVIDENGDGDIVGSREELLEGSLPEDYSLSLNVDRNVDKSDEFEVNARLLGSNNNSSSDKSKTIYQGNNSGVEIDLQAEPQEDVLKKSQVSTRPNTAESLTVKLSSPDDALEYLESVEIKHVSEQETRQAVKEYTGSYEQGEVVFIDGESYNGQELELFPGKWELHLDFGSYREIYKDLLLLLPSEEKEIPVLVERRSGDLEIDIIWDLPPAVPENVEAKEDGDSIEITWDRVDDADSYNILRREPDGRDYWTEIGKSDELSYQDRDVTAGVTYRYAVVAVNQDGLTSDYGESNLIEISSE